MRNPNSKKRMEWDLKEEDREAIETQETYTQN